MLDTDLPLILLISVLGYLVYISYIVIFSIILKRKDPLRESIREVLILIFYLAIIEILLNIDLLAAIFNINSSIFDINIALKNLDRVFVKSLSYLDILSKIALFIAIFDIIVSISSVIFPGNIPIIIVSYKPYTHVILSVINGISQIIGIILILIIILKTLSTAAIILGKYLLLLSIIGISFRRTRIIGKILLSYYIILMIILPLTINISISNVNNLNLSLNTSFPRELDSLKIRVSTMDGTPLRDPLLITLAEATSNQYYLETVRDGKTIVVPRGIYRGISACIYWENFSNSACCYKNKYTECYGCYISSKINTSRSSVINVIIPFNTIPCNGTQGVSGLFHENEGPMPHIGKGYIKFTLTPKNKILDIDIIGGKYKIYFSNTSAWKVHYTLAPSKNYPQCHHSILHKALLETSSWKRRTNINLYEDFSPKIGSLPEAPSAYKLKVWLTPTNSNCSKEVFVNVTIYGVGCWNPNVAYIYNWNKIEKSNNEIYLIGSYFTKIYKMVISVYFNFLLGSSVVFILMMVPYPPIILDNIVLTMLDSIYKIRLFNIKTIKYKRDYKKEEEEKIKTLIMPKNDMYISKIVYNKVRNKIRKIRYKREVVSLLYNPEKLETLNSAALYFLIKSVHALYILGEIPLPNEIGEIIGKYAVSASNHIKYFIPSLNYKRIYVDIMIFINHVLTKRRDAEFLSELLYLREEILKTLMEEYSLEYHEAVNKYNKLVEKGALPDIDSVILYYLDNFDIREIINKNIKEIINKILENAKKYRNKSYINYDKLINILNKISDNYDNK